MNDPLFGISPLDGRYSSKVDDLRPFVSEYGLIKYRVIIEIQWLKILLSGVINGKENLEDDVAKFLDGISDNFTIADATEIKGIESEVNHDVKAVEVWLRVKISENTYLNKYLELVHFGCTSDDINNLAYAMMLRDVRSNVLIPALSDLSKELEDMSSKYAAIPLLAHTHGQAATPTTLGKEIAVFLGRLKDATDDLESITIKAKFNGATGGYNALFFTYPEINWPEISKAFIESFGLNFNPLTTQIEPHDYIARYCNSVSVINVILIDLSRDMWLYISRGVFKLALNEGEVGSSTMPHKVNPIDFENAEGNLGVSNSMLHHLSSVLPISRMQRDLSDSTALRTLGSALGHSLVAYSSLSKGLVKLEPDTNHLSLELNNNWAVLTEAVQTIMRKNNISNSYDEIKKISRGKHFDEATYKEIVGNLEIPTDDKNKLLNLTPSTYVGLSPDLIK